MPGISGNIFGNVADIETRMADNTHPLLIRARQRRWQDERLVASIFQAWHDAGLEWEITPWHEQERIKRLYQDAGMSEQYSVKWNEVVGAHGVWGTKG